LAVGRGLGILQRSINVFLYSLGNDLSFGFAVSSAVVLFVYTRWELASREDLKVAPGLPDSPK